MNYNELEREWRLAKKDIGKPKQTVTGSCTSHCVPDDYVIVSKNDLAQLATEIAQLKQVLPKVLTKDLVKVVGKLPILEEEVNQLKSTCGTQRCQIEQLKSRCDEAVAEAQREKQESLQYRCELQSLNQQLTQQTEYCSSLGSACCTLLWRVSRCEESIQSILVGTKVDEFLSLISSTLESYVQAYKEDWPQDGMEETQFILALCGIITNIAASAFGRDFLITNQHGRQVIDTYETVLSEIPQGKSTRMKNLIMMCMYNVSINQKGIRYLSTKPGLLGLAAWLLQGESDTELRLNCLRLIQSLILDDGNFGVVHKLKEVLPDSVLEQLAKDENKEVRELALEVVTDLQPLQS